MIRRDYHGYALADALRDAETTLNKVRLTNRAVDAEFIVGHGVIRTELLALLERCGTDPRPKLGNDGVIVCVIE